MLHFNLRDLDLGRRSAAVLLTTLLVSGPAAAGSLVLHTAGEEILIDPAGVLPAGMSVVAIESQPAFGSLAVEPEGLRYTPGPSLPLAGGDSFLLRVASSPGVESSARVTLALPAPAASLLFQDAAETGATPWTSMVDPETLLGFTTPGIEGWSLEVKPMDGGSGWLQYIPSTEARNGLGEVGGEEGQNVVVTTLPDIPPEGRCYDDAWCVTERLPGETVLYQGEQPGGPARTRIWQKIDPDQLTVHVRAEAFDDGACQGGCATEWLEIPDKQPSRLYLRLAAVDSQSPVSLRFEVEPTGAPAMTSSLDGLAIDPITLEDHRFGAVENDGGRYRFLLDDFEVRYDAWPSEQASHHLSDEMEDGWHSAWHLGSAQAASLSADAALGGDWGLEVDVEHLDQNPGDGAIIWALTDSAKSAYGARFDLDTTELTLPLGSWVRVLGLLGAAPPLTVDLRPSASGNQIRLRVVTSTTVEASPWLDLAASAQQVAVHYDSEAGEAKLWLDGALAGGLVGLDTTGRTVTGAKIGAFGLVVNGPATSGLGRIALDGFAAWH